MRHNYTRKLPRCDLKSLERLICSRSPLSGQRGESCKKLGLMMMKRQ